MPGRLRDLSYETALRFPCDILCSSLSFFLQDCTKVVDYHTHVAGRGTDGDKCSLHPSVSEKKETGVALVIFGQLVLENFSKSYSVGGSERRYSASVQAFKKKKKHDELSCVRHCWLPKIRRCRCVCVWYDKLMFRLTRVPTRRCHSREKRLGTTSARARKYVARQITKHQ